MPFDSLLIAGPYDSSSCPVEADIPERSENDPEDQALSSASDTDVKNLVVSNQRSVTK